jgi:hypothetical protein
VTSVDVTLGATRKDFGRGFYTTSDQAQAEAFAKLKARREGLPSGWVSAFSLADVSDLEVLRFAGPGEPWFDFVLWNRGFGQFASTEPSRRLDIVIGPVADDSVGLVLNQFVAGVYGAPLDPEAKATAIRLLLAQRLHGQVFFATPVAAARLSFLEAHSVRVD